MVIRTVGLMGMILVAVWSGSVARGQPGSKPTIFPTDPPSLSVIVAAGQVTATDGKVVRVAAATLTFDRPDVRDWSATVKAPGDYADWFTPWDPWPHQGKPAALGPRRVDQVPILGGLFRSIPANSVVVTTADKTKTFVQGEDYRYNADWGQIANIDGRLGTPGEAEIHIRCRYATQRIDLVQADSAGRLSIKRGKPAIVCPMVPEADNGCIPLAGVYIAPWRHGSAFAITAENILPIDPAPPVAPINPGAVAGTLAKLRSGRNVTVALMGDSITLGAEAGPWWDEGIKFTGTDNAYRGRVIHALRTKFPRATVEPIEAYRGGGDIASALGEFEKTVLPAKADLVIIAYGANDAGGGIGQGPRVPVAEFKRAILHIIAKAEEAGMEVILVTPMQPNPWLRNELAQRIPAYRQAMIEAGREKGVGVADVYAEWMNLATRGIPPYTQLHNWINHPGAYGHKVYADVIGRFFE